MIKVLLAILLLLGCIGEPQSNKTPITDKTDKGGIDIIKEREKEEVSYIPKDNKTDVPIDWGDRPEIRAKNLLNYTFSDRDPLYITFFNVGYGEKQGRLVLLRRGDSDVYIWSVPNESYPKAYSYIKSYSDDIEYVIIPSGKSLNFETLDRLKKDFEIGKTIAPRNIMYYYNGSFDIYLDKGDVLEIANYKIEVLQAGEDYLKSNPGDMGLILKVSKGNNCIIMLLDVENGGLQRFNIDQRYKHNCNYFSWNAYGIYFVPDLYINYMEFFKPKNMIADGSSFKNYDQGTRKGIYERMKIYNVNIRKVWENETTTIIFE